MFARPPVGFSKPRAEQAVERALAFARRSGFEVTSGEIVAEGANLLVRLEPLPVLARMSHLEDVMRVAGGFEWQRREVALTDFLREAGTAAPHALAGPVIEEGISISLWEWVEHDPRPEVSDAEAGAALRELHGVLSGYDGPTIELSDVLAEIRELAAFLRERGDVDHVATALSARLPGVLERLASHSSPAQQLHGDAHIGNLVRVGDRLAWLDFEDSCRGPIEYDLACLVAGARWRGDRDEAALLAGYGDGFDRDLLETCIEARRMQVVSWNAILIGELPENRATERLFAQWLADYE